MPTNPCDVVQVAFVVLLAAGCTLLTPAPAGAQSGVAGKISYTGHLGPVSQTRPLCLCFYTDPNLENAAACVVFATNDTSYRVSTFDTNTYYLVAFLDLDENEQLTLNEPFQIYNHRQVTPGDPVVASTTTTGIDFVFGDEGLGTPCVGDCDGSGEVTVDEIVTLVNIALGSAASSACTAGDSDGNGSIEINEIIKAVNNAADGCAAS